MGPKEALLCGFLTQDGKRFSSMTTRTYSAVTLVTLLLIERRIKVVLCFYTVLYKVLYMYVYTASGKRRVTRDTRLRALFCVERSA